MRNKVVLALITLAMSVVLSACGHEHEWEDATCTEPKTCSKCGETEGEALEHTWIEANYQEPKTCSVCGTTEGEPLPADFEAHGLTINVEEGVTYDYVTACNQDKSKTTVGHATFSDYRIIEENVDLGLEKKDGYEWRTVHISILFDDDNAMDYGMLLKWHRENYYDIEGCADSKKYDEETDRRLYVVNYQGTDYEIADALRYEFSGWIEDEPYAWSSTWEVDVYVNVPIGYDGYVFCLSDAKKSAEDGMYIYDIADENTLFFRMD